MLSELCLHKAIVTPFDGLLTNKGVTGNAIGLVLIICPPTRLGLVVSRAAGSSHHPHSAQMACDYARLSGDYCAVAE